MLVFLVNEQLTKILSSLLKKVAPAINKLNITQS